MNTIADVATRLAAALPGQWTTEHMLAAPILHGPDGERFQIGWDHDCPGGYTIHPRPPSGIRDAWNRVATREGALRATESDPAVEVAHRITSVLHRYREALALATALDSLWRRDTADAEALLDDLLAAARLTHYHRESREREVVATFFDEERAGEITVSRTHDGGVCFMVKTRREHAPHFAELLGHHTQPEPGAAFTDAHGGDGR